MVRLSLQCVPGGIPVGCKQPCDDRREEDVGMVYYLYDKENSGEFYSKLVDIVQACMHN